MTLEALKPLLESGLINEETRTAIQEAWEGHLAEAKEQVRGELREEFARRYEHDKNVMVEALDKMVTESLTAELSEFAEEKAALAEDRVKFKSYVKENSTKFNDFMVTKLAEEIKELRSDRKIQKEGFARLNKFVAGALAEEIKEFAKDKQEVVETKVRLIAGAKTKLAEMQKEFVARSAVLVKEAVTQNLGAELTQLKEDIQIARENMFGRRLFEAFATEFSVTHLNENRELDKLRALVTAKDRKIAEAKVATSEKAKLVESKDREIRIMKESVERKAVLSELLGPLNKEKAAVMVDLLEGVQTDKLRTAYNKYLPAVLNNAPAKQAEKQALTESRKEVTGNKAVKINAPVDNSNVIEIKRLAGLN